jgi:hypothetical protein
MNNASARKAEPFTAPFRVEPAAYLPSHFNVEDANGEHVAGAWTIRHAQWLCDRLNAVLPQPTEDSRVALDALTGAIEQQRVNGAYYQVPICKELKRAAALVESALSIAPLAAAPSTMLTETDIDALCKAMWSDDGTRMWDPETCAAIEAEPDSASAKYCERLRSDDRKAMRTFIDRLSTKGDAPMGEKE